MKVKALGEAKQTLSATVEHSQRERILITRHGKPAALLIGVEHMDMEELVLTSNQRFWEMIEASRRDPRPGLLLDEARRRFASERRIDDKTDA